MIEIKRSWTIRRHKETNTSASVITAEYVLPLGLVEEIELYSTHQRRVEDQKELPVFLRPQAD